MKKCTFQEKFANIVTQQLERELKRSVTCKWNGEEFLLNAENQFYFYIDKVKNIFYVSEIISGMEHDNFKQFSKQTALPKRTEIILNSNSITVKLT